MATDTPFMQAREVALGSARAIAETFDAPDDDWAPALIAVPGPAGGEAIVAVLAVDREHLSQAMAEIAVAGRAAALALVVSAWQSTSPEVLSGRKLAREMPDREEVLTVYIDDGRVREMYLGLIERTDDAPPKLGEWERADVGGGFMADALRQAIQAAKGAGA